jgi:DNA-binding transcriptional MerR regulator
MEKQHKNQIGKKKYRIGDLSKALQVKKFVIRFWEKEFELKSDRSEGGQRYYTKEDFDAFHTIKDLLYQQGYTIAGAKLQLKETLSKNITPEKSMTAATKDETEKAIPYIPQDFLDKIKILKDQLSKLKAELD